jgi:hypothetical protein
MRRNRLILLAGLLGLIVLLAIMLSDRGDKRMTTQAPTPVPATPSATTQPTPPTAPEAATPLPSQAEERRRAVELVQSIYSAPIAFYGRAQDQHGQPVAGAKVQYSALDRFWEPGTKYEGVTDASGYFSITGTQGAALSVQVSKEGYDRLYNQSDGAFSYGTTYDPQRDRPTPTKDSPTVFVLRKKAPAEPLVRVRSRQFDVGKNGVPLSVNLETGKTAAAGQSHLQVECWANDQAKDAQGHFDWKCRVTVPGGGLVERNPQHDFEAPEEGYRDADEIVMSASDPRQRWSSEAEREYFVKLPDGRHARVKLTAFAGGRTFFVLESYLNPSGSRNLEYNPALQAAAR